MNDNTKTNPSVTGRVIGFDAHPDSFTAAFVHGPTPAAAITQKICNQIPMKQLAKWAAKNSSAEDLFLLEASGNSFDIVRRLRRIDRRAIVLESCQLGKLKEAHANNDKISALRIAKAYLAGTAKEVWVPDELTQQRRECLFAHDKATRRTTQMRNRIQSYLSDHGVRLSKHATWSQHEALAPELQGLHDWNPHQWQLLQCMLLELRHAEEQRQHWRSLIAHEVLTDPILLSLTRLCGIREVVAYALGAIIGDIKRFAKPRQLVKYLGLNPAFDLSGKGGWRGGIGGHGRKDLRALLMESAQAILRSQGPLAKWGQRLLARKGAYNLSVAAVARKLAVQVWYLMTGRYEPVQEIDSRQSLKIGRIISRLDEATRKALEPSRQKLRQSVIERLRHGRVYYLKPTRPGPPWIGELPDLGSLMLSLTIA